MNTPLKKGLYGVVLSCFHKNGRIDERLLENVLIYCNNTVVDGLILCGSTGEFVYLNDEDYELTLRLGIRALNKSKVLIAGASGPTEAVVLQKLNLMAELGYQYALVCPPYYYPQSHKEVLEFYQTISRKAPQGIQILLYHIPFCTTGIDLKILPLLLELPNVVAMKDSSGDMLYHAKALLEIKRRRPEFFLFTGQDMTLLSSIILGGSGCMSSACWILDKLEYEISAALQNGDLQKAKMHQYQLSDILLRLDEIPFPENYRALARIKNIDCGYPQREYSSLQGDQLEKWAKEVESAIQSTGF